MQSSHSAICEFRGGKPSRFHVSFRHAPGKVVKIKVPFFMESAASDQINV